MSIQELFTCDKSEWFTETNDGIRIWKTHLVADFWTKIKTHKIDNDDYNFENFVFPSCSKGQIDQISQQQNFYIDIFSNINKKIKNPVTFKDCRFQGSFLFLGNIEHVTYSPLADITFLSNFKFQNCSFEKEFRLQAQKFEGSLSINNCLFFDESSINFTNISGNLSISKNNFKEKFIYFHNKSLKNSNFSDNIFAKSYQFGGNTFNSNFGISNCEFNGKVSINGNNYIKSGSISHVQFNSQCFIKGEKYNNFQFQDVEFSSKNNILEEIKFSENGILTFRNQIFTNSFTMRNCDCRKIKFINSEISEIKFSSCTWNLSQRIILHEESLLNKNEIIEIQILEEQYRQLKRNFEKEKDWELSGKAYVSEMTFRQLRLYLEKDYFSWFIYWFYDFFGGYTQNYVKPIFWLFSLTTLIFPSYYFIYENSNDVNDVFIKSIAASIPWLQTNLQYENWGILAFQKTLSTILLTFIILALRKRFKE